MSEPTWTPPQIEGGWTTGQLELLLGVEHDLRAHMAQAKPRRFRHSLSVADTACALACAYQVDPYEATLAGLLHDWDKVLDDSQQLERARELGVDLGVDLRLVSPLLHGLTAARTLPQRYPFVGAAVWQAIERHTIGAADMSALDMVVFVADGIEPLRPHTGGVRAVREMLDACEPLENLFFSSFSLGMSYVIETRRYLYPGTLEIYNQLVLARGNGD
jgi:predicted HD superfamily hydrolase involved in NAD metabolism